MIWQENGHGSLTGPRNASERSHRRYASMTAGHTETDGQTDVETDAGTYRAVWQVLRAAGDAADWRAIVHTADDLTCCVETATTQSLPCTDHPTMFNKRMRHETYFKAINVGRTASRQCGTACHQPCGRAAAAVRNGNDDDDDKQAKRFQTETEDSSLRPMRNIIRRRWGVLWLRWCSYASVNNDLLSHLLDGCRDDSPIDRPHLTTKLVENTQTEQTPTRRRLANANRM